MISFNRSTATAADPEAEEELSPEEIYENMIAQLKEGQVLARAADYPEIRLELVKRGVRLDEVDFEIKPPRHLHREVSLEGVGSTFYYGREDDESEQKVEDRSQKEAKPLVSAGRMVSLSKRGRGVTHLHPMRVLIASGICLITWIFFFVTIIGIPALMYTGMVDELGGRMVLFAPLAVLGALLLLCVWRLPLSRCSVCMQPMIMNLSCVRNQRAHRFALGNTAISTAIVALFTLGLRCPYCGTKQNLQPWKKSRRSRR